MKAPSRGSSTLPIRARNDCIVNMLVRSHALRATSIRCAAVSNADRSAPTHNANDRALFPARLASNHARGKHAISAYHSRCLVLTNGCRICPHYACPVPCGSVSDSDADIVA